jgi:hypothetical protein
MNSKHPGPPMTLGNLRSGIVAKQRDRPYRSGRSPDWTKVKNPDAPAASRIME